MRILHLPVAYLPWTIGGREIYCHTLCCALNSQGIENIVAFHQDPSVREPLGVHEHEGIDVHVLPTLPGFLSRQSSYTKVYSALPGFEMLLDELSPDVVHFHDQGGGASLSHLRAVKRRKIPAIITYHSPGQTCPQRDLLQFGTRPCDGEVKLQRCTACRLSVSGVPKLAANVVALAEWPGAQPWSPSPFHRVLSGRMMTRLFRDSLHEFIQLADYIVILAEWSRKVWLLNGCPPSKLRLVRTGGKFNQTPSTRKELKRPHPLKLVCLGRCTWVKGFHVLIEAVKLLPKDAPVEVHFLGPYWNEDYGKGLLEKIHDDPRFLPPRLVPNPELRQTLEEMDVAIIPSLWLETGPLSLFDAFGAGLPILGSRLGGIEELVHDKINGLLFPPGDARSLAQHIMDLLSEPKYLTGLRDNVPEKLQTMDDVATEMKLLYEELLVRNSTGLN